MCALLGAQGLFWAIFVFPKGFLLVGGRCSRREDEVHTCVQAHTAQRSALSTKERIPSLQMWKGNRCYPFFLAVTCGLCPACRMATVSKDGTWKFWDTDVEYKKQQDPYLLLTGKCEVTEPCHIALSPDAHVAAISCGTSIIVYNTRRGEEEERFVGVHGQYITDLAFDTSSRYLVSCGDRAIRVFHNTAGYRAVVEEMETMLKKTANKATRERLEQQITSARKALAAIYGRKH